MTAGDRTPSPGRRLEAAGQVLILTGLAALLFPAMSPGAAVSGGVAVKLLFLARMVVLLGLATWFLRMRKLRWIDVGLRRPRWRRFALAMILGLLLSAGAAAIARLGLGLARPEAPASDYSMFYPLKGDLRLYLYFLLPVTWGSAAFGEELIFRGFVLGALEQAFGGRRRAATLAAVVVQAPLFGLLHIYQGVGGAMTAGAVGLALGVVWLVSGRNLWAAIVVHGLIDSAAMTAFYMGATPH
jgi:membrane protease YdiL (CAAX protease family)